MVWSTFHCYHRGISEHPSRIWPDEGTGGRARLRRGVDAAFAYQNYIRRAGITLDPISELQALPVMSRDGTLGGGCRVETREANCWMFGKTLALERRSGIGLMTILGAFPSIVEIPHRVQRVPPVTANRNSQPPGRRLKQSGLPGDAEEGNGR